MDSHLSSRRRYTPSNNIAGIKSKSSPYLCLQKSGCGYFVLRMRGRPPLTPPHKPKQQNGKKITSNPQSQPQDATERNRQEGLLPQSLSVWRDSNISQNVQPKKRD